MTTLYSFRETVLRVPGLTEERLTRLVAAEVVRPVQGVAGDGFGQVDVARLRLACELCEGYALEDEALAMVMELIDRMHGLRRDLRVLADAVEAQPDEVRRAILVRVSSPGR
jgi:chaperone modulatory protein CbpM